MAGSHGLPNIVLILSDDQGFWTLGCSGNPDIETPVLDGLAAGGTRFDNFFCASPVCSPARASLLTGLMPSRHGVHDWIRAGNAPMEMGNGGVPVEYLAGIEGYTDILARKGYTCGISGKWHLGSSLSPQKSFSFWEVHAQGAGPYYNAPMVRDGKLFNAPGYVTDVITDNALRFLDQQTAKKPFCLSVHYTAPHNPWERSHHPPEVFSRYYESALPSFPGEPAHPWQTSRFFPAGNSDKRHEILSGYCAAITEMDRNIGRILAHLERKGIAKDTLVFFTSDNGMNMGHHGIFGKGNGTFPLNMFDTSVKVPAIAYRPGHVPAGVVRSDLLSHYDFMPTVLDYVGLGASARGASGAPLLPGRSFAPILRGDHPPGRDFVVVHDEYGPVRMVRTREWKYVHRYPYGPHELYDLASDPGERRNLYRVPAESSRISALREMLETWFLEHTDPDRDGLREHVTGQGQIGLVGLAGHGAPAFVEEWTYRIGGGERSRRTYSPYDESPFEQEETLSR